MRDLALGPCSARQKAPGAGTEPATSTTVLLTPEELDDAVKKRVDYRPRGGSYPKSHAALGSDAGSASTRDLPTRRELYI